MRRMYSLAGLLAAVAVVVPSCSHQDDLYPKSASIVMVESHGHPPEPVIRVTGTLLVHEEPRTVAIVMNLWRWGFAGSVHQAKGEGFWDRDELPDPGDDAVLQHDFECIPGWYFASFHVVGVSSDGMPQDVALYWPHGKTGVDRPTRKQSTHISSCKLT